MKKIGEFDEFITGKMELTVGGKDLKLDVTIKDKRKLKTIIPDGQSITEEGLEKMDNTFLEILKRSYPDEKSEAMEGFYNKHDVEFMQEFFIKVGWTKREDLKVKAKN